MSSDSTDRPLSAAEEDPTVPPNPEDEEHGVGTASGPSVSELTEDGLPEEDDGEVEVGLGPED